MNEYISKAKEILDNGEYENEDLIEQFLIEAETDEDKQLALKKFFKNCENPFETKSYFELMDLYESILEEK